MFTRLNLESTFSGAQLQQATAAVVDTTAPPLIVPLPFPSPASTTFTHRGVTTAVLYWVHFATNASRS